MYGRKKSRWLKHLDFMLLDIFSICISLMVAYGLRHGFDSVYARSEYTRIGLLMVGIDIILVFFRNSYRDVIRRGYLKELGAASAHFSLVMVGVLLYLFAVQRSEIYSRLTLFWTWGIGILFMYLLRISLKTWLRKRMMQSRRQVSVLAVVSSDTAQETVRGLLERKYRDYEITGLIFADRNPDGWTEIEGVPVVADRHNFAGYIKENVVDELFVNVSGDFQVTEEIMQSCIRMGITVHQNLMGINKNAGNKVVDEFAGFMVLTSSIKVAAYRDLFLKRCMDIAGALAGLFLTMILFPFIAAAIKRKSPGPALFTQERIGKNGRKFRMYKFRSMYMDAEKRKKDLMRQNEMNGLMFKIEKDPRIIPGVGEFIRKTSLDEFPQFWNVLKGDMSLIGTRPPTVEEYEQYNMNHLVRISIRPGMTGLWQVSGRNKIRDFEEVVRLDTRYIEEWSLTLDIKILIRTVMLVIKGDGE